MAVTVYRSTDSGAPTMSGTAGDLIKVLDQCLVNGYGAFATNTITSNNTNVSNADTVTINGVVYTFVTSLSGAAYEIFIGATADASLGNLRAAINATGTPGTDYGLSTPKNRDVTAGAVTSHAITLTAILSGTIGNALTLAKSAATLTVGGANFTGGSNSKTAAGWSKPYSQQGAPYVTGALTSGTIQAASGTTSPTNTINATPAVQAGDLMIMYVWTNDGVGTNTLTTPTTAGTPWIAGPVIRFAASSFHTLFIFWKICTTDSSSGYTVTSSASCAWQINGIVVRGWDTSVAPVFSTTTSAGGSATQTTPAMSAPESQDLSISLLSVNSAASLTVSSRPTSYSNPAIDLNYVAGANQAFWAYRVVPSGSTGTLSWTLSGAPANTSAAVSIMIRGVPGTQAVYRGGSGVQHYYHIDDNSPGSAGGGPKEAQLRGSETASAFQTGTAFFPLTATVALGSGIPIRKSGTTDATTRAWICIADDRTYYLMILTGDLAGNYLTHYAGEIYSIMSTTDNYRSIVVGRNALNSGGTASQQENAWQQLTFNNSCFIARSYTGTGGGIQSGRFGDTRGGQSPFGTTGLNVPNGPDGALHIAPIHWTNDNTSPTAHVRGRMRGAYHLCHGTAGFADGDTITGAGPYAGRTFLLVRFIVGGNGSAGQMIFDITGPWETN